MKHSSTITMSTLAAAVLGVVTLGLAPSSFAAPPATTTFAVTATVQANCTVGATAMNFGSYSGALINNITSSVTVTCTNTTPYTLALSGGSNGTVTTRAMKAGAAADLLNYGLYSDAARLVNFATSGSLAGNGAAQSVTIYGAVPALQFVAPSANYTDTITATVAY
jgi:spore coat protein U-like protein